MRHLILSVLLLALSIAAHGQLYKWVDKNGTTQYSDQPPPAGVAREQKQLDIKPAQPAASGGNISASQRLAEKELEFRKRRAAEDEAEARQLAEARQNQEKCTQARGKLRMFQEVPRLTIPDGAGGIVYADDAARQRGIDEAQKDIATYCR